jgi:hypothetical protein
LLYLDLKTFDEVARFLPPPPPSLLGVRPILSQLSLHLSFNAPDSRTNHIRRFMDTLT